MQRTLIATLTVALLFTSLGGAYGRCLDHNAGDFKDYYERHTRNRNMGGLGGRLDLNRASTRELDDLPGVNEDDAYRILANRPYVATQELVDRQIIEPRQYDIIEDFIYACRVCPERCGDVHRCVPCRAQEHAIVERRG